MILNHTRPFLLFLFVALFCFTCKPSKDLTRIKLSDTQHVVFLDSLAATTAITTDQKEEFFERISKVDVSIQMKKELDKSITRDQAAEMYKAFLKTEVLDFTPEEIAYVTRVFNRVYKDANQLSNTIFPKRIRLIKTHGNHYGASVFYTREDCIVIPKDVLVNQMEEDFHTTMHHELFHIYSRYNPVKRKALYELIGFKAISVPKYLKMSEPLRNRILLNPDGINFAYAITLESADKKRFQALPIIVSNELGYVAHKPSFFSYLNFNLYQIQPSLSRLIRVDADEKGFSKLKLNELPDFFRQIKDNTQYIIHPDEILADNYAILATTLDKEEELKNYSEPGQELLAEVKRILMQ